MYYYLYNSSKTNEEISNELRKVATIYSKSYSNNKNLTKLSATDVTTIDDCAFENCINLKEVFLGIDIKTIKENAFINCSSLTDVWFPVIGNDTQIEIAESAFENCGDITFHIFGYFASENKGNASLIKYAKRHHYKIVGMI